MPWVCSESISKQASVKHYFWFPEWFKHSKYTAHLWLEEALLECFVAQLAVKFLIEAGNLKTDFAYSCLKTRRRVFCPGARKWRPIKGRCFMLFVQRKKRRDWRDGWGANRWIKMFKISMEGCYGMLGEGVATKNEGTTKGCVPMGCFFQAKCVLILTATRKWRPISVKHV